MSECNAECGEIVRVASSISVLTGDIHRVDNEVSAMKPDIARLIADMYNGGKDGLKTVVTRFIADSLAREDEREKIATKRYNTTKTFLTVISIVVAFLTLCVGGLGVLAGIHSIKSGEISKPPIFSGPPQVDSVHEFQAPIDGQFNPITVGEW